MRRDSRGTEAGRAWWWAVLRTERDRRLAAARGWPITTPNLRRLLSRRLARVGENRALCEHLGLHISSVLAAGMKTELSDMDFSQHFKDLTKNDPLSWQIRLYKKWFAEGNLPPVIDLPTGLGKTMVMAIWLIARANHPDKIPTRLIYVVDRRTVVDQATDLAERLRCKFGKDRLAISTLRGQLADNREWSRDPSRSAIIIGTVDLIGSALLFSGYRSGFKTKPLHAGLLGQDSLLVLDEAHLSKPFEQLLVGRKNEDERCQNGIEQFQAGKGKPMRVIRMSATSGDSTGSKPFTLQFDAAGSLTGEDAKDQTITDRFGATKTLSLVESEKPVEIIAAEADKLAVKKPGSRIVIFVRTPKLVADVRKALEKKNTDYATRIAQLTGTMRGLERDELVDTEKPLGENDHERRVMQRFLKPDNDPSQGNCFLISTSAGEVGFDLNADNLVGDESPLDSLIQRLGRVNRRGNGDATVILVKEKEPAGKTGFDKACIATSKLFTDGMAVSPKALAAFKKTLTPEQIDEASSPKPAMVELTDILLDAWSMTSIVEPMPGRPEVAPWIRGIDEELPETVIAWRAELDLSGFDQLDLETIEEWFDTHRVLTHETLSVPTSAAAKWFTDRWDELDDRQKSEVGSRPIIVDRAGLKLVTVKEVVNQLGRKNTDSIRNADLILPASFGGIERGKGLLDADAPEVPKDESRQSAEDRAKALASRQAAPDVADEHGRYRELVTKTEEGEPDVRPIGLGAKPPDPAQFIVELESDDDKRVRLISYVPKRDKLDLGSEPQSLKDHVTRVRYWVDRILGRLSVDEVMKRAAQLAADYHDHGKARERWQRLLVFPSFIKPDEPMGKSGGKMKRDSRGYRHEFGSLREFIDAHKEAKFTDSTGKDITKGVIDLALHLIAVHHGRGRPHFPKGGFDPDCESRSNEIHTDSIRRFARLQRKYGWWHLAWLENLLRCADAMASSEQDATGVEK
jgi:CRISPR-associated endonuclease/helicase Cas3